jgi:hypothetical protein
MVFILRRTTPVRELRGDPKSATRLLLPLTSSDPAEHAVAAEYQPEGAKKFGSKTVAAYQYRSSLAASPADSAILASYEWPRVDERIVTLYLLAGCPDRSLARLCVFCGLGLCKN